MKSIALQIYQDFEVIVIDDGSQEIIEATVKQFKSNIDKLHFYRVPHGGANKARQYGAELASGEYIIFWDGDVIGRPEMLETMLETLRNNPRASYAYSAYKYGFKTFKVWPFDAERLRKMPYIHTTSLIRYKHFCHWDQDLERLQDWDVWLTMLENGYEGIYIPQTLFRIITGGTMSTWLPKIVYKKPFKKFLPPSIKDRVKKYEQAVRIIKQKHHLS
jgi:glycosyltransferase involved in cell wall biosynthesis